MRCDRGNHWVLGTKTFSEARSPRCFHSCKHKMGPFPLKQTEKGVGVQDEAIPSDSEDVMLDYPG